jgi:hypothetical protein
MSGMAAKEPALAGKRILLIALPGYPKGMIRQMQALGAEVDYINDKPNDGFLCKTLGRLQLSFYQKVIDRYYGEKIDALRQNRYDYILVIRGEYTTKGALLRLQEAFPSAKRILYMWDGLHKQNTRGIEEKWKYYDKVFTFDRIDYEANRDQLHFLPLFYYEEYLPRDCREPNAPDFPLDVSFIGTGHADRVKIVKAVMAQCRENGLKTFDYVFMPHPLVFWRNKLTNRDFKGVTAGDVHYKMLPFDKLYQTYADSRCVVDVENPGQHGLTMRTIEIVGLKRKFITTNRDIVHYDFYHPDNILVLDRENPTVDMEFFKKPYVMLPPEIYEKYSLRSWILAVLG